MAKLWRKLQPRTIGARLNTVAIGTIVLVAATLFAWRQTELQHARSLASSQVAQRRDLCERIVRDRSNRLHAAMVDFASWPEFGEVFHAKNPEQLALRILPAAERMQFSFRLLSRNGKVVYESKGLPKGLDVRNRWFGWPSEGEKGSTQFTNFLNMPPKANVPQLQYFLKESNMLYEVAVSPLYGRNKSQAKEPIGYMVACQPWGEMLLGTLGRMTETTVRFSPTSIDRVAAVGDDAFDLRVDLPGIDDPPLGDLVFRYETNVVAATTRRASQVTLIFVGLTMLACALSLGLAQRWLVRPVQKMQQALTDESPAPVEDLLEDPTEVGNVAEALVKTFDQQMELEAMTEELTALNEELTAVNEELSDSNDQLLRVNELLEARVQERTAALTQSYEATILGWSKAMDSRDQETEGHTQRVAAMALKLAQAIGLDERQQQDIYYGALVHDIGKIGIPDAILLKADKLTPEEFEVMKTHPRLAEAMLLNIEFLRDSISVPKYHHERWDGTGYPEGLAGEAIPMLARVFAVADVWDALRSHRPYRQAWTEEATRAYIAAEAGRHFDPAVVHAFLAMEPMPHPSDTESAPDRLRKAA